MNPIKPNEVDGKKINVINQNMIGAVNNMIVKHWNGSSATFKQKDLIEEYFAVGGIKSTVKRRTQLYEEGQLDFEPVFRNVGWIVAYDKPGV